MLVFGSLDADAIDQLLGRAEAEAGKSCRLTEEARGVLVRMADGDGRACLSLAEEVWRSADDGEIFDAEQIAGCPAAPCADL